MTPSIAFTQRLRLEPVNEKHLDDIAAMHADPRVAVTMGGLRDRDWVEQRLQVYADRWAEDGFGLWAAYSLADGSFVGRGGIQHTSLEGEDVVEVGWCLTPEKWRQGFATEMGRAGLDLGFGAFGLDEIVSFTLPHNAASRAVMQRLGMTYVRDCVHADLPHVVYAVRQPA